MSAATQGSICSRYAALVRVTLSALTVFTATAAAYCVFYLYVRACGCFVYPSILLSVPPPPYDEWCIHALVLLLYEQL